MEADPANVIPPSCPGCAERDRRISQLERRLKDLEQKLESALRSGKRQAAPFSKGPPKAEPRKPGRKGGEQYGTHQRRRVPPRIDEVHEAELPRHCPHCNGTVMPTEVACQYQAEVPRKVVYRQFNVQVGRCRDCGRRVQGRHPLQTSDALGAAASQLGPDAQALAVQLNKEAGLSHGKVSRFFKAAFDLDVSRSGACRVMLRVADRCREVQRVIVQRVQRSPFIVPDETGWRIGGRPAWLHAAVGADATAYLIHRRRGFEASAQLIGPGYAGKLVHDGWAPYERFLDATHQTCLGHLLRRCHELLEHATAGAVRFPRQVKGLLQDALALRDRRDAGTLTSATIARRASLLEGAMQDLLCRPRAIPAHRRFSDHLWGHCAQLFTFLYHPGLDATNYRGEQALRPAVVNRKVWGGSRTDAGAEAQSILMSVMRTCWQRGIDAVGFLSHAVRAATPDQRPLLFPDTG